MSKPRRILVRTESDVLALVPYSLGFHPEDSLVLLTMGAGQGPFHARVDLPTDPDDLRAVVAHLAAAAARNGATTAVVVVYTDDAQLAEGACARLVFALTAGGARVVMRLRADGERWYPLGVGATEHPGSAYDVRAHPLSAEGVLDGKVTYTSRHELSDSLLPADPDAVDAVEREAEVLDTGGPAVDRARRLAEAQWVAARLHRFVADREPLAAADTARLLLALRDVDVRDVAWVGIERANAPAHVLLWRDLVRRSPMRLLAAPSALLAFAAWLAGDGALAWCAIDRCRLADPDYRLAELVGDALHQAMPPSAWRPFDPGELTLFAG